MLESKRITYDVIEIFNSRISGTPSPLAPSTLSLAPSPGSRVLFGRVNKYTVAVSVVLTQQVYSSRECGANSTSIQWP
jgi:hypothetical protein